MNSLLIVEDEPDLQELLALRLKKDGYEVACASDGAMALKTALDIHPDLILLDVALPKMSGLEMLKQLRLDEWGKSAKVIVLSNNDGQDCIAEAVSGETAVYLIKAETTLSDILKNIRVCLAAD